MTDSNVSHETSASRGFDLWYRSIARFHGEESGGQGFDITDMRDAFTAGDAFGRGPSPAANVSHETSWQFVYYRRLDLMPYTDIRYITLDPEMYAGDIQAAIESLYSDPSVMRVYQLRQCYGIGRRRGE